MKLRHRVAALWVVMSLGLSAQTLTRPASEPVMQPGLLESDRVSTKALDSSSDGHDQGSKRLWIISLAAMAAGTSMDAATSWGKREGNGLLAQGNGSFGPRGTGIKAGVAVATLVPQILLRKHPELRKAFIVGNFTEAGVFTGTAIHNLKIK